MLTIEYYDMENNQYPKQIHFSTPPDIQITGIDQIRNLFNQHKPKNVLEFFLKQYVLTQLYQDSLLAEQRYAKLMNENTIEHKTTEYGIIKIIDFVNVPQEILSIEQDFPYLAIFRQTKDYENSNPPSYSDEDIQGYPINSDIVNLARDYNRWYYEIFILNQGYQPQGYDFKVYSTIPDLQRLETAINIATQTKPTNTPDSDIPFDLYCYDGLVRTLTLEEAKNILADTWNYVRNILQQKADNRIFILYATTMGELMDAMYFGIGE